MRYVVAGATWIVYPPSFIEAKSYHESLALSAELNLYARWFMMTCLRRQFVELPCFFAWS